MENNVTIYKAKRSIMGGGLVVLAIVFFGLTFPLLVAGLPVATQKLFALAGFWLVGIALTLLPLGFRLEIGENYVKSYFFGLTISNVQSSDVQVIVYGNLFLGGLGGKGITYRVMINGKSKAYSIGEVVYGKKAIAHAKRVLEQKLN